jgi:hypothetical protein
MDKSYARHKKCSDHKTFLFYFFLSKIFVSKFINALKSKKITFDHCR